MTLEMSAFKKDQRVPGSEEVGSLLDGETEACERLDSRGESGIPASWPDKVACRRSPKAVLMIQNHLSSTGKGKHKSS